MTTLQSSRGRALPLGITTGRDGLNFALLCRHGTKVSLVLYPLELDAPPFAEVVLDRRINRTGDHWHIFITGLPNGFRYGCAWMAHRGSAIGMTPRKSCSTRLRPCSPKGKAGRRIAVAARADQPALRLLPQPPL